MEKPLVSITIPVYNGEKYLRETIKSALAQTYRNIEIVIVIDGTHDGSEMIIKEMQQDHPDIITYRWQENKGLTKTRNVLIDMAKGEYIALLDQDDLWRSDKLEKQMTLFAKDPSVGLVYSSFTHIDASGKEQGEYQAELYRGRIFNELFDSYSIPCPSIVFKKEVTQKVGMFEPIYRYSEEADFVLKVALYYAIDFVPEPLCSYRNHAENTSRDEDLVNYERYLLKRNVYRFAKARGLSLADERAVRAQIMKLLLVHLRGQVFKLGRFFLAKARRQKGAL
jgi:glycosyltransferase involved in cell wall biosynthesis